MNKESTGLVVLRLCLGVFLIFEGLDKLSWLTDSSVLTGRLQQWLTTAGPYSRWYIETVCLPGAAVFARLVLLGELSAGAALVLGFWTRVAAVLAFLMVLNFHVASGLVFQYRFLTNGYALPVLGGLLALALGGGRLPLSLKR